MKAIEFLIEVTDSILTGVIVAKTIKLFAEVAVKFAYTYEKRVVFERFYVTKPEIRMMRSLFARIMLVKNASRCCIACGKIFGSKKVDMLSFQLDSIEKSSAYGFISRGSCEICQKRNPFIREVSAWGNLADSYRYMNRIMSSMLCQKSPNAKTK